MHLHCTVFISKASDFRVGWFQSIDNILETSVGASDPNRNQLLFILIGQHICEDRHLIWDQPMNQLIFASGFRTVILKWKFILS